mmetsp:Transcript_132611/g.383362  ORF Transcript_132611/g.383362 Transcript_132611/m.383362 type:complete len:89 (-) Transcript_132611:1144-1410(-)
MTLSDRMLQGPLANTDPVRLLGPPAAPSCGRLEVLRARFAELEEVGAIVVARISRASRSRTVLNARAADACWPADILWAWRRILACFS